jgi:hypothetical protein
MEEENPCKKCQRGYCFVDEFCMKCNGTGKITDFTIGLGPEGLVPSYIEKECPQCKGVGYQKWACEIYLNEDWG